MPRSTPQICNRSNEMIDTPQKLSDLCSQVDGFSSIALDTEFISGQHPDTILSVVQMALRANEACLIDVLAFDDLGLLKPVLENPSTVKILHDAGQDLGLIAHATGARPRNIFDVKLAARLLGAGKNYSLSELVQNLCSVRLSKSQQRSNWLRRPLSPAQIKYAERDVFYLHQIRRSLIERAEKMQRTSWLEEEMKIFDDPSNYQTPSPAERLLRSPTTLQFSPQQRAIISVIVDWRTDTAQAIGILPKNLLRDKEIMQLAKRRCKKLVCVRGACASLPRRYELELIDLIAQALDTPASRCPASLASRQLTCTESAQLHLLQAVVAIRAHEYQIGPEIIATNTRLSDFIRKPEKSSNPLQSGWRWDVAGRDLMEILRGRAFVKLNDGLLSLHSISR